MTEEEERRVEKPSVSIRGCPCQLHSNLWKSQQTEEGRYPVGH